MSAAGDQRDELLFRGLTDLIPEKPITEGFGRIVRGYGFFLYIEFAGTPLNAGADRRWIDTLHSDDRELAREVWRRTSCADEAVPQ
jgi:hypothetical protein